MLRNTRESMLNTVSSTSDSTLASWRIMPFSGWPQA